MIMKRFAILVLCLMVSCEKVWVEDLQERAYDTIRGVYEIESIVWEEAEPIDIDGDGEASFDYLAEWNKIYSGSPSYSIVSNEVGSLGIPYVVDQNAEWGDNPSLSRWSDNYTFKIKAVIEGNDSHLEFELPKQGEKFEYSESEFTHSGYAELTLRTMVTLDVLVSQEKSEKVTGTIFIKYIRTEYRSK